MLDDIFFASINITAAGCDIIYYRFDLVINKFSIESIVIRDIAVLDLRSIESFLIDEPEIIVLCSGRT